MKTILVSPNTLVKVDDEDYEMLRAFPKAGTWWSMSGDYAATYDAVGTRISMHRIIMKAKPGEYVDHINGNTLDNQKSNLRFCSNQQNIWRSAKTQSYTSSKFKGVSVRKTVNKLPIYRAYIVKNNKQKHLGSFMDEVVAAERYDVEAVKLFNEYALLNFPDKLEVYKVWLRDGMPTTHTATTKYGRPFKKGHQ